MAKSKDYWNMSDEELRQKASSFNIDNRIYYALRDEDRKRIIGELIEIDSFKIKRFSKIYMYICICCAIVSVILTLINLVIFSKLTI